MKYEVEAITSGVSVAFAGISWSEINEVLSVVASCISIAVAALTLITMIIKWFKNAKADGKITSDEIADLVDTVKDGANQIKQTVEQAQQKGQEQ